MISKLNDEEIPHNSIFINNEVHFYLNGDLNKQNMGYWCEENPRVIVEKLLHSEKLTIWMEIAVYGVIPYVFNRTVNGEGLPHDVDQAH